MKKLRFEGHEPTLLYHGGEKKISRFTKGILFLTGEEEEAIEFSKGSHMFGTKRNTSYVYTVEAREGKTSNSDDVITDYVMENDNVVFDQIGYGNDNLDSWVEQYYAPYLRNKGFRFFTFYHPSAVGNEDFLVVVSLYPDVDLKIIDVERL